MKSRIIIIIVSFLSLQVNAQLSVSAGPSLFNNFGIGTNFYGFDIGGEYSDSDEESYWGRISFYPGKRNRSIDSVYLEPYDPVMDFHSLNFQTKTSYIQFSGGSRYYIGDGYQYGLAAYGGYKFSVILGTCKFELDPYDELRYKSPSLITERSQLFSFGIGLNGGVKYSFGTLGTVFLDTSLDFVLWGTTSTAGFEYSDYLRGPLFFSINLGFRKDLDWY